MHANYQRANGYRTEEVSLRPRGNTVTVDVPSDNPFEDDALAGPTVSTQASGGISKAPQRQRSRKIVYKGAGTAVPAGALKKAIADKNTAKPARYMRGAGIFGLGAITERPVYAVAPRNAKRPTPSVRGFMPGMGDLGVTEYELTAAQSFLATPGGSAEDRAAAQVTINQAAADQAAAEKRNAALSAGVTAISSAVEKSFAQKTAASAASAQKADSASKARIAEADAKKADALARGVTAQADAKTRGEVALAAGKSGSTKWLVGGGVAAILAIGAVAFILIRNRKNKKA